MKRVTWLGTNRGGKESVRSFRLVHLCPPPGENLPTGWRLRRSLHYALGPFILAPPPRRSPRTFAARRWRWARHRGATFRLPAHDKFHPAKTKVSPTEQIRRMMLVSPECAYGFGD
jgi:hypothetical protein